MSGTDIMAKLQEHVMECHAESDPRLPERVMVCRYGSSWMGVGFRWLEDRWGNCRRFFNDKTKFSHHTCMHTGMKNHVCDKCNQQFTSESQLRLGFADGQTV